MKPTECKSPYKCRACGHIDEYDNFVNPLMRGTMPRCQKCGNRRKPIPMCNICGMEYSKKCGSWKCLPDAEGGAS